MPDDWKIARKPRLSRFELEVPRTYVSINKRGEIAMNPEAWRQIRGTWNVTLLYDESRRQLGIKFPATSDQHFFSVCTYGREGRMGIIRAARALKQFGIEVDKLLVFKDCPTQTLNGHPMLVLDLGLPI